MSSKKTIFIIISLMAIIVLIIVAVITALLIKQKTEELNSTDFNLNTEFEKIDTYETKQDIELLKNKNKYYVVRNIINTYVDYINQINSAQDTQVKEIFLKEIYNILDVNYINDCNITKESLQKTLEQYNKEEDIRIEDVYFLEKSSSINIYIVNCKSIKDNKEHKLLIKTDSQNSTFSIFLEDYITKYNISENNENININEDKIEENKSNKFRYTNISDEQMAINYFQDLKWLVSNDKQELYNKLDEDYKNARFDTMEEFNNYIENFKNIISGRYIDKYQVSEEDGHKRYLCMDQKGQYYIFKENAIMEYALILDTYTLDLPEFIDKYNNSSEQEKAGMNIEKILEAVNNKDYKYVYNKVNNTFKNNNFEDINKFIKYINTKFYNMSDIDYKSVKKEGNAYIYDVDVKNTEDTNKINNLNIIVKLKEGTDFEISFGI